MKFLQIQSVFVFSLAFVLCTSCNNNETTPVEDTSGSKTAVPGINYSLVKLFPHDTSLYTEGLLFHDGRLYESTGSPEDLPFTKSLIVTEDLASGKFEKKVELDKTKYFGEGIVFLNDKLYQLTYKSKLGFIYDAKTFKQLGTFNYSNAEGWGLTTDGRSLVMSDGTDKLTYLNPNGLTPIKVLSVTENNNSVPRVNELEFIKGFIYANVWQTNTIVKIDTASGNVVGKLDLNSLAFEAKNKNPNADVLNGIAYDPIRDKVYVTGKLWPNIYEISFSH